MLVRIEPLSSFIAAPGVLGSMEATTILTRGETFEGWCKCQAIDPAALMPAELAMWQGMFGEIQEYAATVPKVGLLGYGARGPGERAYAIAVPDDANLWLVLWVKVSQRRDVYVFYPHGDTRGCDPHTSYHRDGSMHSKSFGEKFPMQRRQPLDDSFTGSEHLGRFYGYGPAS